MIDGVWDVISPFSNNPSPAGTPAAAHVSCFCRRRGRRGKSTTFITPRGLTLASLNLRPPSSISSSTFASLAHWTQSTGRLWCTAAPGLDAQGLWPWWTHAWSW